MNKVENSLVYGKFFILQVNFFVEMEHLGKEFFGRDNVREKFVLSIGQLVKIHIFEFV